MNQPSFDATPASPASDAGPFGDNTGERALEALVRRLTDNYFDVSFDYGKPDSELQEEYRRVFPSATRDFQSDRRCRNIILVGAGASFAAFGRERFPLAQDAIKRLKKYLGVRGLMDALRYSDGGAKPGEDRLTEEEERVKLLTGIASPKHDFESQLAIYSKFFTPRQVRAAIQKIYLQRYYPHLVFETISHLLKHRFVDAVISYNFDELLDQAIEEELGGSEYRVVISDGDTADLSRFVVDEQLKVPLYIKPHGTASHKSSLRFTKDDYVGMPRDLQVFTRKILHGDTREDPDTQRERFHVNLICIGFAFSSVELLHSLRKHRGLSVFHINTHCAMDDIERQINTQLKEVKAEHFFLAIQPPDAKQIKQPPERVWQSLEELFRELPRRIAGRFDELYRPRSLDRHHFIHALLFRLRQPGEFLSEVGASEEDPARSWPYGSGIRVPVEDKHYHYARLCVEIAIALAKGNGRIDLTGAMLDRVGTYYKQWRDCETGEGRPLRDVCTTTFGLTERYGFSRTIYALRPSDLLTADGDTFADRAANFILDHLMAALNSIDDALLADHLRNFEAGLRRSELQGHLRALLDSDAHDVAPTFDLCSLVLVTEPRHASARIDPRRNVLNTSLSLTSRFQEMVRTDHWHLLLAISEQGKILDKLAKSLAAAGGNAAEREAGSEPLQIRKRISVIVADDPENEQLQKRLREHTETGLLLPDAKYRLPFWAHNNHMVIAMRMEFDRGSQTPVRWTPVRAIAYKKLALSPKVNPILVEQREDLDRLVTMYFGYVAKALQYGSGADHRLGVPDVDVEAVAPLQERLLDEWWHTMVNGSKILPARQLIVGDFSLPGHGADLSPS
ncbi:MAG TPA: SIR2 family protein [Longimicrobium sp.]|nr:SIR2 family protein [Longimicrobium sp.]